MTWRGGSQSLLLLASSVEAVMAMRHHAVPGLMLMKRDNLEEIYSFDMYFNGTEVTRVME